MWRSWSWLVLERSIRTSRTNTKKICPFHHRGLESKSRKSRGSQDTWQVWPWSTKWSRAKANRVLTREHAGHRANMVFQQLRRWIYTWTLPDCQYQNQIDFVFCSQRWRSSRQSAKTRLGADCGSDNELLIAKLRFKLKKVGKTTRPLKYNLNQIPYDYTVKVTHRFKGLDLVYRVPEELWTVIIIILIIITLDSNNTIQEAVIKTISKKKKCKKAKWLSEGTL